MHRFLLFVLIITTTSIYAQVHNVDIGAPGGYGENKVAFIMQNDTGHLIIGAMSTGSDAIGNYWSSDNGKTWSGHNTLFTEGGGEPANDPWCAFLSYTDSNFTFMCALNEVMTFNDDWGASSTEDWEKTFPPPNDTTLIDKPMIVTDNNLSSPNYGYLYLVYTEYDSIPHVHFRRSNRRIIQC